MESETTDVMGEHAFSKLRLRPLRNLRKERNFYHHHSSWVRSYSNSTSKGGSVFKIPQALRKRSLNFSIGFPAQKGNLVLLATKASNQ